MPPFLSTSHYELYCMCLFVQPCPTILLTLIACYLSFVPLFNAELVAPKFIKISLVILIR